MEVTCEMRNITFLSLFAEVCPTAYFFFFLQVFLSLSRYFFKHCVSLVGLDNTLDIGGFSQQVVEVFSCTLCLGNEIRQNLIMNAGHVCPQKTVTEPWYICMLMLQTLRQALLSLRNKEEDC